MFKFTTLKETDFRKIFALKEHANLLRGTSDINFTEQTRLVMPHVSYILGLSSLKLEEEPKPRMNGTQIIEATLDGFKSIFNLYSLSDSQDISQMTTDEKYLQMFEHAFDNILHLDVDEKDYEIRSISVPALHVEALWLHSISHDNNDFFVPIRSLELFEDNKIYNKNYFFNNLKKAVINYDMDDNLIGG